MPNKLPALIASAALLILSLAALAAATPSARAQDLGPALSGGAFPLLSWGAVSIPYNAPPTLYTVPAGKKMLLRTFCTMSGTWHMRVNGVQIVPASMTTHDGDFAPLLCDGRGQLVLEPGDVLSIGSSSSSTSTGGQYYAEGTLVAE